MCELRAGPVVRVRTKGMLPYSFYLDLKLYLSESGSRPLYDLSILLKIFLIARARGPESYFYQEQMYNITTKVES